MFKLRCNNKILSEHNTLLEAKMKTLLSLKNNPSLKLIEVLDDNNEIVYEKELEEPTQEEIEVGVDTVIRNLITRWWENITELESAKVTLADKDVDSSTIDILSEMIDNTYEHLGSLESCLSDNNN